MIEDSIKRIRLEIVAGGLAHMLENDATLTRKDFFITQKEPLDHKKKALVLKANASKNWQVALLDRFIEDNILEKVQLTNGFVYSIKSPARVKAILDSHKDNGLMLAHYLFPNEVVCEDTTTQTEQEPIAEEVVEVNFATIINDLLKVCVAIKENQQDINRTNKVIIDALPNFYKNNTESYNELTNIIRKLNNGIDDVNTSVKNVGDRHNGTNKRIDEMTQAFKDQKQVLDANQQKTKELVNSIGAINDAATQIKSVVAAINEIQNLTQSVNILTSEIRAKENSKVDQIGKQIQSNLNNLNILGLEMIAAVAESTAKTG